MTNRSFLIVTRHAGLVAWLEARGIVGGSIPHATAENVAGRAVIGALPLHLAALAASVTVVDMPGLTAEQRGRDLTPAEMDAAGASLSTFIVRGRFASPLVAARARALAREALTEFPALATASAREKEAVANDRFDTQVWNYAHLRDYIPDIISADRAPFVAAFVAALAETTFAGCA